MSSAPSPPPRAQKRRQTTRNPRIVDAEIPTRSPLRRNRNPPKTPKSPNPQRTPPHGLQPNRQRRNNKEGSPPPRLQNLLDQSPKTRQRRSQQHLPARPTPPRRHYPKPQQLPRLRPRRDFFQQAASPLRNHQETLARRVLRRG